GVQARTLPCGVSIAQLHSLRPLSLNRVLLCCCRQSPDGTAQALQLRGRRAHVHENGLCLLLEAHAGYLKEAKGIRNASLCEASGRDRKQRSPRHPSRSGLKWNPRAVYTTGRQDDDEGIRVSEFPLDCLPPFLAGPYMARA